MSMSSSPDAVRQVGPQAAPRFGRAMLEHWALDPAITYLNHGTVGAPPRRALVAQQAIRDEIERQPSRFLLRELSYVRASEKVQGAPRLRTAAEQVATFLGARGDDLVFVDNATTAVNAVLRSVDLRRGDEILILDHAYGAVRNAADFIARERGARVRVVELPYPVTDPAAVVEAVVQGIRSRTRLALVDHITSESALVLPLAEIAARCRARGVAVLVDGAHAPGAIPLELPALGVDWYAGNLHKWAWSPRSSAILWADPARQPQLHPTVISWGLGLGYAHEFDWVGTRDPSAHLAAPAGIVFMQELGVQAVQRYNHDLAWNAGRTLSQSWGTTLSCPESMVGTMLTAALPERAGSTREHATALRDALLFEDHIEVQVHAWRGRLRARLSAQIYNESADVERLAAAVSKRL